MTFASSIPPEADLGEPPDIIRDWAEKVIGSWSLTDTQRRILDLMLKGLSDNEIAAVVDMNPKTVKMHLAGVRKKSGCDSRAEIFAEILRL